MLNETLCVFFFYANELKARLAIEDQPSLISLDVIEEDSEVVYVLWHYLFCAFKSHVQSPVLSFLCVVGT